MGAVWEQRFSRELKQLLDMRESTALEALPDLMPVIPVLDASSPALLRARDEILWSATVTGTALAGNYRGVGLQCNSLDTLAIVTRTVITNTSGTAYTANLDIKTVLRESVMQYGQARDTRERSTRSAAFTFAEVNAAALNEVAGILTVRLAAGESYTLDEPILLTGVAGLLIETTIVNLSLAASFFWSERTLRLSER